MTQLSSTLWQQGSSSVLGIDAQVLAGSLAAGPSMGQAWKIAFLYQLVLISTGYVQ